MRQLDFTFTAKDALKADKDFPNNNKGTVYQYEYNFHICIKADYWHEEYLIADDEKAGTKKVNVTYTEDIKVKRDSVYNLSVESDDSLWILTIYYGMVQLILYFEQEADALQVREFIAKFIYGDPTKKDKRGDLSRDSEPDRLYG